MKCLLHIYSRDCTFKKTDACRQGFEPGTLENRSPMQWFFWQELIKFLTISTLQVKAHQLLSASHPAWRNWGTLFEGTKFTFGLQFCSLLTTTASVSQPPPPPSRRLVFESKNHSMKINKQNPCLKNLESERERESACLCVRVLEREKTLVLLLIAHLDRLSLSFSHFAFSGDQWNGRRH